MDEVQLSTAASALQRIHESVPNSQHSEALQCSVWQVAGSPAFRVPPSFNLPSWILDRGKDEEYFSRLPPAMMVALVAVSLRAPHKWDVERITAVRAVLHRVGSPNLLWAQLVMAVFDRFVGDSFRIPDYIKHMIKIQPNDPTDMIRKKELHREEYLWLLSTLSELRTDGWLTWERPFLIGICLAILLDHAPKWDYINSPDIVLLDAVVTLIALSCAPYSVNRLNILTSSREHPWLLLNIRNPNLIGILLEGPLSRHDKQLTSLLFLGLYALIYRDSVPLAVQYFTMITAEGNLPLYASALTAIAPSMNDAGLSAIGRMLVAAQEQDLASIIGDSMHYEERTFQEELLNSYDHRIGANENPDPNIFAILLLLSKHLPSDTIRRLQNVDFGLKIPG